MTVSGALFGQRCRLSGGHIFQPFGRFLWGAGANVNRDVGLRYNLIDEVHEFMGSEGVRLDHSAPIGIEGYRSRTADPVSPVIFVGEAAAGQRTLGT